MAKLLGEPRLGQWSEPQQVVSYGDIYARAQREREAERNGGREPITTRHKLFVIVDENRAVVECMLGKPTDSLARLAKEFEALIPHLPDPAYRVAATPEDEEWNKSLHALHVREVQKVRQEFYADWHAAGPNEAFVNWLMKVHTWTRVAFEDGGVAHLKEVL